MTQTQFRLVVTAGGLKGQTFPLEGQEVVLGRASTCDITLPEPEISRRHARLVFQAGGYAVEDLGSTNGTFVNEQRVVGPHPLRPGDRIRLGPKTVLVYEPVVLDPDATVAVAPVSGTATPPPPPQPAAPPPPAPAAPQPITAPPAPPSQKGGSWMIYAGIGLILLALCACVAILWYIDANYLWCTVFPFIPGC